MEPTDDHLMDALRLESGWHNDLVGDLDHIADSIALCGLLPVYLDDSPSDSSNEGLVSGQRLARSMQ